MSAAAAAPTKRVPTDSATRANSLWSKGQAREGDAAKMRARVARVPWRWRVQYRAVRTARRRPRKPWQGTDTQTRTTITRAERDAGSRAQF